MFFCSCEFCDQQLLIVENMLVLLLIYVQNRQTKIENETLWFQISLAARAYLNLYTDYKN